MRKLLPSLLLLWILWAIAAPPALAQIPATPTAAPPAGIGATSAAPPPPAAPPAAQVSNDSQTPVARTPCGTSVAAPFALPPPGSPPFVWILQPCFSSQGGFSTIENETYM